MRALLTDGVRGCPVKALHRELVTTCPCMSLIEIHDSETHWITTLDTANEIHEPIMRFTTCLTRVATHKVLDKCLGLDSSLACLLLLNFWPHVAAPSPTIRAVAEHNVTKLHASSQPIATVKQGQMHPRLYLMMQLDWTQLFA